MQNYSTPRAARSRSQSHRLPIEQESRKRKIKQVTNDADRGELERHYSFVPDEDKVAATWQDRMVQNYHDHLFKEYVLADLTRPGQIGLRWRTEREVRAGKGEKTCGNKHCPSHQHDSPPDPKILNLYFQKTPPKNEQDEQGLLNTLPYGLGLDPYEVPFQYKEHGRTKQELVKLCLCLRCAPLIFQKKLINGQEDIALQARTARSRSNLPVDDYESKLTDADGTSSRKRKRRKKWRKRRQRDGEV